MHAYLLYQVEEENSCTIISDFVGRLYSPGEYDVCIYSKLSKQKPTHE